MIKRIWDYLLAFIYPNRCVFCRKIIRYDHYCKECQSFVHNIEVELVTVADEKGKYLKRVEGCISYNHVTKRSIIDFKFNKREQLSTYLTEILQEKYEKAYKKTEIDFVVAVPLHNKRKQIRGFNQSEILAKGLCAKVKLPYEKNAVKRIVNTKPQSSIKNKEERIANLKNAFCADEKICQGKNILIIDDVLSTGSTLKECAKAMISKGAQNVYTLVALANKR